MGSPYDQLSDPELMATIMWLESRGEGEEGMRAVGHVLKNRVGFPGFPQTLRAVIFQKNAFSCLIPSNPEYGKLPQAGDPQFANSAADSEWLRHRLDQRRALLREREDGD